VRKLNIQPWETQSVDTHAKCHYPMHDMGDRPATGSYLTFEHIPTQFLDCSILHCMVGTPPPFPLLAIQPIRLSRFDLVFCSVFGESLLAGVGTLLSLLLTVLSDVHLAWQS
jgi:hypothetical protein